MMRCRNCGLRIEFRGEYWYHAERPNFHSCAYQLEFNRNGNTDNTARGILEATPLTKEDKIVRLLAQVDEMA